MPEEIDKAVDLNLEELQAIDPKALQDIQQRYGLEIQVRSSASAINRLLQGIGKTGMAAEFTRGFDRTSPGYDKYYNRDYAVRDPLDEVVLPADRWRNVSLEEALKTLSVEQFQELKKQLS